MTEPYEGPNTPTGSQTLTWGSPKVTASVPNAPGVYHEGRETKGPNAFSVVTGMVIEDTSAKWCNKDCIYSGKPGVPVAQRSNWRVSRFHGYDSGRQGVAVVVGDNGIVEDSIFENVARSMFDLEPTLPSDQATNLVFRRLQLGNVGSFLVASKGQAYAHVSAVLEDVVSLPNETLGNLLWCYSAPNGNKHISLANLNVNVRGDISDTAHITDRYGVKIDVVGDPKYPIFCPNVALQVSNVVVNGRLVTVDDCQWRWQNSRGEWEGTEPVITGDIAPPPPPVDPPPPPDDDLATRLNAALLRESFANAERDAAIKDRDVLAAKIAAARQALG